MLREMQTNSLRDAVQTVTQILDNPAKKSIRWRLILTAEAKEKLIF